MEIRSITVALIRLSAIIIIFLNILTLCSVIGPTTAMGDADAGFWLATSLPLAGLLILTFALWFLAPHVAGAITRDIPTTVDTGKLSLTDIYNILLVALGLYFIVDSSPSALAWIHWIFSTSVSADSETLEQGLNYEAFVTFTSVILGIALFCFSRKWAALIATKDIKTKTEQEH